MRPQAKRATLDFEALTVQAHRMHLSGDLLEDFLKDGLESWCVKEATRLGFDWRPEMKSLAKV